MARSFTHFRSFTQTNTRPWPVPPAGKTINAIGDVHVGRTDSGYASGLVRAQKFAADVQAGNVLPAMTATVNRVQVGDFIEDSTTAHTDLANTWANSVPSTEFYGVVGNHDVNDYAGGNSNNRTPDQAVTAFTSWTNRTGNWTANLGFCKLIGLKPEPMGSVGGGDMATSAATHTTFLGTELGNTSLPCVIIFHCPLASSVLGDTALEYTSVAATDPNFAWNGTAAVKTTLNAHSTAKVVLSGHTHTRTDGSVPSVIDGTYSVGTRDVIAINASAVVYQGKSGANRFGAIKSFYLTFTNDNKLQIRVRDHGVRCWSGIGNTKLTTVDIPA